MAITVWVPTALRVYCDGVSNLTLSAPSVGFALEQLAASHPSLYRNVCDETGTVRRHINVFVNKNHIRDLEGLDTALSPGDVILIVPAVSGG
jgi:molybdopterin synthase sulfur carrier subunit